MKKIRTFFKKIKHEKTREISQPTEVQHLINADCHRTGKNFSVQARDVCVYINEVKEENMLSLECHECKNIHGYYIDKILTSYLVSCGIKFVKVDTPKISATITHDEILEFHNQLNKTSKLHLA
jgi:hypothetical protein